MDSSRYNAWNTPRHLARGLTGFALTAAAIGCGAQTTQQPAPAQPAPPPAAAAQPVATESTQPGAPEGQAAQPQASLPAPVVVKDVGFKTPESVLYNEAADLYLVSNVNGSAVEADGNGFISKVGPDGKVVELKWIDGTKPDVTLNAPKGMAVSDGLLYVTDINFVRLFDAETGEPKGKVGVPGATFLNDIVAAKDGTVYVSDSGLKAGKDGFEPTGSDSIYRIGKRRMAEELIADKETLGRPNGLVADEQGVWVASYGSNELYKVTSEGKKENVTSLPKGSLDGVVLLPDGSMLVASWEGSAVYHGMPGGEFSALVQDVKAPADIGYDSKRHALLIPLFQSDSIQIQQLAPVQPQGQQPAAGQQTAGQQPASQQQPAATGAAKPAPQQKAATTKAGAPAKPQKAQPAPADKSAVAAGQPDSKKGQQTAAAEEKAPPAAPAKPAAPAAPAPKKK